MDRAWTWIIVVIGMTLPAMAVRLGVNHTALTPGTAAVVFGVAILGGAFLLTWAAEVAEMDISQGLALAFLALVAVLPEYAVDLYFAWSAAAQPEYTAYATANMTGANRLLIGIAWPLIVLLYWIRTRRTLLVLPADRAVEMVFLTIATAYSFVLPFKRTISLLDMVVLVGCFVGYMWRIAGAEAEEPEIVGPAVALARLRPALRRSAIGACFAFSAAVILGSAEPFAEALIHLGRGHGIDEFLLVQWLAPVASEAPEVVIACILTLRGRAQAGMGAMVSAKVNQWTLLVGTLPLVYSAALGRPGALHLDARQVEEILLTAAQSLFAIAVLCDRRLSIADAAVLFLLFVSQLFFPDPSVRYGFAGLYVLLAGLLLLRKRRDFFALLRTGLSPRRHPPHKA